MTDWVDEDDEVEDVELATWDELAVVARQRTERRSGALRRARRRAACIKKICGRLWVKLTMTFGK